MKNTNANPYAKQSIEQAFTPKAKPVVCLDLLTEPELASITDRPKAKRDAFLASVELFYVDGHTDTPELLEWKQYRKEHGFTLLARPVQVMTDTGKQARLQLEIMDGNQTVCAGYYSDYQGLAKQTLHAMKLYVQNKQELEQVFENHHKNPFLNPATKLAKSKLF